MTRRLAWLPALTMLTLSGPVLAGVLGTLAPAFGWQTASGFAGLSLDAFHALFDWPGFATAVRLSITTGFGATLLSLTIVALICAAWSGTRVFGWLERLLSPLLAVPHAAAAFGLAFLIAPSGWISRFLASIFDWDRPLDVLIIQDAWGLAMMAGLVVKEVPFLLLMIIAAYGPADASRSLTVARALGYARVTGWMQAVFPRIYAQIRLPVYVVLAYSLSVVDVAFILGPNMPPTLSAQLTRWMSDPDLLLRNQAAAGALVQLALVIAALAVWRLGERLMARLGLVWILAGRRRHFDAALRVIALCLAALCAGAILLGLASLAAWSIAGFWGFPDLLPDNVTTRSWVRHGAVVQAALWETASIALTSALLALLLVIGCLEAEQRHGRRMSRRGLWLLYLPLLVPQIAFLPGMQTLLLLAGANHGHLPVVVAHLVFVLPYVFLTLADPYRAWEPRYATIGAALGASPDRVLWRLRLPMLLAPLLTAFAVGVAVSVGQYLPTLLVGGGRVATLTTEAVALAAGGDRRAIGVYGLAQTGAALLPFAAALAIPALAWRHRRGLRHG